MDRKSLQIEKWKDIKKKPNLVVSHKVLNDQHRFVGVTRPLNNF